MSEQVADQRREGASNPAPGRRSSDAPFLMVFGWLAFAVIVLFRPDTLGDIWRWLGDLPIVAEVLMWIFLLPWVVGIAIWESGVGEWQRAVLVSLIALAWIALAAKPTGAGRAARERAPAG